MIRESLAELLEMEGYCVDRASNGQEAINHLNAVAILPDLILLDLMMPVKDGFQFRKEQQSNLRLLSIPIIIMSADGKVTEKQRIIGSIAYVKKPIDINQVLHLIHTFFEHGLENPPR